MADDSLYRRVVPAHIRTFAETLAGDRSPITEKNFTDAELRKVKDSILASRERQNTQRPTYRVDKAGKVVKNLVNIDPTVDYRDYGKDAESIDKDTDLSRNSDMRNTLGKFRYDKTEAPRQRSRVIATDQYDFKDDLVSEGQRSSAEYAKMSTLGKLGALAKDTVLNSRDEGKGTISSGLKSLPSRVGSAFVGEDGRPVHIDLGDPEFKRGGKVKSYAKGGAVKSASRRADGIATRGKTRA
jgi:hypothetical protein